MFKIQVDKFGAAEQDCSLSLSLDPTYIKALQRRMTARIGINIFHISLDPTYIKALQKRMTARIGINVFYISLDPLVSKLYREE